ncbi:MAG: hypothetical protein ABI354_02745 [Candidatus Saccharimonadales bacterium]
MSEHLSLARTKLAAGLLAASLAISGCAAGRKTDSSPATSATVTSPSKTAKGQLDDKYFDLQATGVRKYRDEVKTKHLASIVFGMCQAWSASIDNRITVTLNPGLGSEEEGNYKNIFTVFSATDNSTSPPRVIMMNGPGTLYEDDQPKIDGMGPAGVVTLVYKDGQPQDPGLKRKISDEPAKLSNGDWAYTDLSSGRPVVETRIVDGPLNEQRVGEVCDNMRGAKLAPKILPEN